MKTPSLRTLQLSIPDILQNAWNIFTTHFQTILIIILMVYIPINLIIELLPPKLVLTPSEKSKITLEVIQALELFFGIIATMAIAYTVENTLKGRRKVNSSKKALITALKKWGHAIGTNIIMALALIILFFLLIVPGIIYYVFWQFALFAVILRGKFGPSALSYSASLVIGRWWLVAGYSLVFWVFTMIISATMGIIGIYLPENIVLNIIYNTSIDIIVAYFTVVSIIFFLSLEKQKKRT